MAIVEEPLQKSARDVVLDVFPQLMIDKGYIKMTVQDILAYAQVGRTTFYSHFTGKEDVLRHSVGRMRAWLECVSAQDANAGMRLPFTLHFFQHIINHHALYDHLVGRDEFAVLERYFRRMLSDLAGAELHSNKHTPAQRVKLELVIQQLVGALWAASTWWLERKQLTDEEINECFRGMVLPGLEQSLATL